MAEPKAGRVSAPHGASAPPGASTPHGVAVGWRIALAVPATLYAAAATVTCRGLVGGFGPRASDWILLAAATAIAMLAILPMGAIIDLPQAIWEHAIPERRWRDGRCPSCGYANRGGPCPECGAPHERPPSFAMNWSTLRRAAWILVPSWALGLAAGMAAVAHDEARFRDEVAARRAAEPELRDHARPRIPPAGFARLEWNAGRGFRGPPPFESPKVRTDTLGPR